MKLILIITMLTFQMSLTAQNKFITSTPSNTHETLVQQLYSKVSFPKSETPNWEKVSELFIDQMCDDEIHFTNITSNKKSNTSNHTIVSYSILSEILKDTLTIEIALPVGYENNIDKEYNTIYLLDANYFFDEFEGSLDFLLKRGEGMTNIVKRLTESGDIPPSILIGIGYTEQQRSLFTMNEVSNFYDFLSKELIPYIESRLRASKSINDRLLFGYSGSAHFSTYVLLQDANKKQQTFNKFISISGVYKERTKVYNLEEKLSSDNNQNVFAGKRLFMGIGDRDPKKELLNAHRIFTKKLVNRGYSNFRLFNTEFTGRGHYDIPEIGFEEGLKWMFKK